MRKGALFVVISAAACAAVVSASVASCTYGTYDGTFDSAGLDVFASDGSSTGAPPVTMPVPASAKKTIVPTADGVFDVTVLEGTFTTDTTLTITQLADRTLEDGLIVPTYAVSAGAEAPKLPVQVTFHGNITNTNFVAPALQQRDGSFAFVSVLGASQSNGGGGPSTGSFWGITKALGVFSLRTVPGGVSGTFFDLPSSCLGCCSSNTASPNGATAALIENSCACASATPSSPECFIGACADTAAATSRCAALAATRAPAIPCRPGVCAGCGQGGVGCGTSGCPSFCCMSPNNGTCTNAQVCCVESSPVAPADTCYSPNIGGGSPGNTCTGPSFVVRCTNDGDCKGTDGRHCCVVGSETLCVPDACSGSAKPCLTSKDCGDAGADAGCVQGRSCPMGTCGTPPTGCQ